jgi:multicomponent Na+:H+ antiporter subunit D
MVGAASISAFPLFSGFVSKSLTVAAVAESHHVIVWFMLLFASAGVFHHAGIKVPFFIFFGHDAGIRSKEPPINMRVAMGIAAFICIFLGVYPAPLYHILPYPVDFVPYTAFHVVGMLQLLMFGALAFTMLILSGFYPPEQRALNLDIDWFVRLPGRAFIRFCHRPLQAIAEVMTGWARSVVAGFESAPFRAVEIEKRMDWIFHTLLVELPERVLQIVQPLKTEKSELSWNVVYILIPFILLLLAILIAI